MALEKKKDVAKELFFLNKINTISKLFVRIELNGNSVSL